MQSSRIYALQKKKTHDSVLNFSKAREKTLATETITDSDTLSDGSLDLIDDTPLKVAPLRNGGLKNTPTVITAPHSVVPTIPTEFLAAPISLAQRSAAITQVKNKSRVFFLF